VEIFAGGFAAPHEDATQVRCAVDTASKGDWAELHWHLCGDECGPNCLLFDGRAGDSVRVAPLLGHLAKSLRST